MNWSTLEEVNLALWTQNLKLWTQNPLVHLPFITFQCWHKCHHLKSLTSLGHHHMILWWHHDLFWWGNLCMHLVTWAEVVALSTDAKVDALVTPFVKGGMVAPGAYHDIYMHMSEYVFMHICMYGGKHVHTNIYIDICMHTHVSLCMDMYTCT